MAAPKSTTRLIAIPKWVARTLSVIAALLALTFFGVAGVFHDRGLTNDTLAAVAAALIGCIFLIASVAGLQIRSEGQRKKPFTRLLPDWIIRIISLLLGSIAVFGGCDYIRMSFILLNQNHLHWFDFATSYNSGSGSQQSLLIDFAIPGLVLTGIGLFLLWYAIHLSAWLRMKRRPECTPVDRHPETPENNAQQSS